jgi:hypothetical protein
VEKGGFAERLKAVRAAPAPIAPPVQSATAPAQEPASAPTTTAATAPTDDARDASPSVAPATAPTTAAIVAAAVPTTAAIVAAAAPTGAVLAAIKLAAEAIVAAGAPAPAEAVVRATSCATAAGDAPGELEVWFWDEMRLGLHGQVRRVWAPVGEKVEQLLQIQYKWIHLVLAVCPSRGEVRWCWVPNMKGPTLAPIVSEWFGSKASAVLVWDGAPGHRNRAVEATGVRRVLLPPYSPELDPAERVFRAIRPEVEGQVYANLEEKQAIVEAWVRDFGANPARVRSLTAWSWLLEQIKQAA